MNSFTITELIRSPQHTPTSSPTSLSEEIQGNHNTDFQLNNSFWEFKRQPKIMKSTDSGWQSGYSSSRQDAWFLVNGSLSHYSAPGYRRNHLMTGLTGSRCSQYGLPVLYGMYTCPICHVKLETSQIRQHYEKELQIAAENMRELRNMDQLQMNQCPQTCGEEMLNAQKLLDDICTRIQQNRHERMKKKPKIMKMEQSTRCDYCNEYVKGSCVEATQHLISCIGQDQVVKIVTSRKRKRSLSPSVSHNNDSGVCEDMDGSLSDNAVRTLQHATESNEIELIKRARIEEGRSDKHHCSSVTMPTNRGGYGFSNARRPQFQAN